jgi:hypothetical protein
MISRTLQPETLKGRERESAPSQIPRAWLAIESEHVNHFPDSFRRAPKPRQPALAPGDVNRNVTASLPARANVRCCFPCCVLSWGRGA